MLKNVTTGQLSLDQLPEFIQMWSAKSNKRRNYNRILLNHLLSNLFYLQNEVSNSENVPNFKNYLFGLFTNVDDNYSQIKIMKNEKLTITDEREIINIITSILDDYLDESNTKINTLTIKLTNIDVKRAILRRWYGYGLKDRVFARDEYGNVITDENGKPIYAIQKDKYGNPIKDENGNYIYIKEQKATSFENLSYELFRTVRNMYALKNELLDDLAPSFFGIDGIYLDV